MKRVVVVGGGICGLAAAKSLVDLTRKTGSLVSVTLLEGSERLGGNIITERRDGFVIDGGPDSWVANKPQASELAKSLGLEGEMIPTVEANRKVYVGWGKGLFPLPEGLVLAVPTRIRPILESGLFSWAGKARMGLEPMVPAKSWEGDEDESIGDFITRRLGPEVTDRLAGPLLGGIFAGDASMLSVRATFPMFVEMEKKHGSLVLAMRAQRKKARAASPSGSNPTAFYSLRQGMASLVDAVADYVTPSIDLRKGVRVRRVVALPKEDRRGRFLLELDGDEPSIPADSVILAAPAHASASMLEGVDSVLARELGALRYASTATAFMAFRRKDVAHPLDGVGFIVPRSQGRPILAGTWVSSKWAHRAPEGHVLMRVFFGGAWGEQVLAKDDDELVAVGLKELRETMGSLGEPLFSRVFRFQRTNPQPEVGHLVRMKRVRARLAELPGLLVAGSGLDGVGIPDCIRQAESAAAGSFASLGLPVPPAG